MSEKPGNLLESIIKLGELDSKLGHQKAQRVKFEEALEAKKKELKQVESDFSAKSANHSEAQKSYSREEKYLQGEQQKLVDRRKALHSLSSYKLQMAAEKEIEAASKALGAQEENLIKKLVEIEDLENLSTQAKEQLDKLKDEFEKLEAETKDELSAIEERLAEIAAGRDEIVAKIDPRSLSTYKRIVERYPTDPVVPLEQGTCSGCFLGLGPQFIVQISRAEALVRCRGCGRILYLPESDEE